MPSTVTENGKVTPAIELSPLSVVNPEMSSGLNCISACTMVDLLGRGCTEKPSVSCRLSSRIFPLNTSGYAAALAPPAPWKPIVALWPLALPFVGFRYLTFSRFEPSWICTCALTGFVPLTVLPWKSMMNVRFGLVPTVP